VLNKPDQSWLIRFFIAFFLEKPDVYRYLSVFSGKLSAGGVFGNNSIHDGLAIVMDNRARSSVGGLSAPRGAILLCGL